MDQTVGHVDSFTTLVPTTSLQGHSPNSDDNDDDGNMSKSTELDMESVIEYMNGNENNHEDNGKSSEGNRVASLPTDYEDHNNIAMEMALAASRLGHSPYSNDDDDVDGNMRKSTDLNTEPTIHYMNGNEKKNEDNESSKVNVVDSLTTDYSEDNDNDIRLAMEMALAATHHTNSTPNEIHQLVGNRNKQARIINDIYKKKQLEEIDKKKQQEFENSQKGTFIQQWMKIIMFETP